MRVRHQIFSSLFACFLLCCSASLWLGSPSAAWAQSTSTGTVAGTVTDPSGALVAGATVTLTDTATKTRAVVTTNDAGRYIFVDVTPGAYEISITKQGFSTTKTQTTVQVGEATTSNLALQVGGSNVVVEVTAVGNELQTMNATVGNTVTAIAIDNLPSIGRDVNTFIELQPGVARMAALRARSSTRATSRSMAATTPMIWMAAAASTIGVYGIRSATPPEACPLRTPAYPQTLRCGAHSGRTASRSSRSIPPTRRPISTVLPGAEIKVVTKRGTNAFHGTAYEYYRDNNWSGNTWQNSYNQSLNCNPFTTDFPAIITVDLEARSVGRSSRKRFSAARPTSFSTMKASAFRTPRPSIGTFPRQPCSLDCCWMTAPPI